MKKIHDGVAVQPAQTDNAIAVIVDEELTRKRTLQAFGTAAVEALIEVVRRPESKETLKNYRLICADTNKGKLNWLKNHTIPELPKGSEIVFLQLGPESIQGKGVGGDMQAGVTAFKETSNEYMALFGDPAQQEGAIIILNPAGGGTSSGAGTQAAIQMKKAGIPVAGIIFSPTELGGGQSFIGQRTNYRNSIKALEKAGVTFFEINGDVIYIDPEITDEQEVERRIISSIADNIAEVTTFLNSEGRTDRGDLEIAFRESGRLSFAKAEFTFDLPEKQKDQTPQAYLQHVKEALEEKLTPVMETMLNNKVYRSRGDVFRLFVRRSGKWSVFERQFVLGIIEEYAYTNQSFDRLLPWSHDISWKTPEDGDGSGVHPDMQIKDDPPQRVLEEQIRQDSEKGNDNKKGLSIFIVTRLNIPNQSTFDLQAIAAQPLVNMFGSVMPEDLVVKQPDPSLVQEFDQYEPRPVNGVVWAPQFFRNLRFAKSWEDLFEIYDDANRFNPDYPGDRKKLQIQALYASGLLRYSPYEIAPGIREQVWQVKIKKEEEKIQVPLLGFSVPFTDNDSVRFAKKYLAILPQRLPDVRKAYPTLLENMWSVLSDPSNTVELVENSDEQQPVAKLYFRSVHFGWIREPLDYLLAYMKQEDKRFPLYLEKSNRKFKIQFENAAGRLQEQELGFNEITSDQLFLCKDWLDLYDHPKTKDRALYVYLRVCVLSLLRFVREHMAEGQLVRVSGVDEKLLEEFEARVESLTELEDTRTWWEIFSEKVKVTLTSDWWQSQWEHLVPDPTTRKLLKLIVKLMSAPLWLFPYFLYALGRRWPQLRSWSVWATGLVAWTILYYFVVMRYVHAPWFTEYSLYWLVGVALTGSVVYAILRRRSTKPKSTVLHIVDPQANSVESFAEKAVVSSTEFGGEVENTTAAEDFVPQEVYGQHNIVPELSSEFPEPHPLGFDTAETQQSEIPALHEIHSGDPLPELIPDNGTPIIHSNGHGESQGAYVNGAP